MILFAASGSVRAHDDILATKLDGGNTTGIGAIEVDVNVVELDVRVFEGIFVAGLNGNDFARDEPGANAPSSNNTLFDPGGDLEVAGASPLGSEETVTIEIQTFDWLGAGPDDLYYWDGTGPVDFQPTTAVPSLSATSGQTSTTGLLDFHPDFEVNDGGGAAEGVYLMSFTLTAGNAAESEPGFIVWLADNTILNENDAEEAEEAIEAGTAFVFYEQAVEYVERALIPEPTSAALVSLAGALVFGIRRRTA